MSDVLLAILHLDATLLNLISDVGAWIYAILFGVILAETGLVITPFLPGDSLLFAAGTFAAVDVLNVYFLLILLSVAAIGGDTMNYVIGRKIGEAALRKGKLFGIPLKREYLEKTRDFYARNGAKTVLFARFLPIVRTFAPFVAGIARMHYPTFALYNIIGGIVWVCSFVLGGYFFGNIPLIKENFSVAIVVMVVISFLPSIIGFLRAKAQP